jgi:hypothetical protein
MQVVFGECELAVGDEPNKEAAVAAALHPPAHGEAGKSPPGAKPTNPGSDDAAKRRRTPGTEPPPSPT